MRSSDGLARTLPEPLRIEWLRAARVPMTRTMPNPVQPLRKRAMPDRLLVLDCLRNYRADDETRSRGVSVIAGTTRENCRGLRPVTTAHRVRDLG